MSAQSFDPPRSSRLPYQPALDGIRAAAVGVVLFFHGGFDWASGAFLGISTFFTLSGFLITGILVGEYEATGDIRLTSFWGRRIRRLMPAALLTLFAMAFYAAFVASPADLLQLRGDVLSALFYVANWRFWLTGQSYLRVLTDPSPVQHLWSLSIEEQFYLFFPLIVLGTMRLSGGSRRALAAALIGLAAVSGVLMVVLYGAGDGYSRAYYGTDTRAAELLVGALLALWCGGNVPVSTPARTFVVNAVGLASMAATGWLWVATAEGAAWFFEGGSIPYALLSAAIIYAAIHRGPVRAVLSLPPLRWMGLISYGLYVYHWPIFLWLDAEFTGLAGWALFAVRVGATFLAATLSYLLIEVPIRARSFFLSEHERMLVLAAFATVVLSTTLVTASLYRPGLGADEEEGRSRDSLPTASGPRILVVGDSVARNVGRGLVDWNDLAKNRRMRVYNRGEGACGVVRRELLRFSDGTVRRGRGDCSDDWPAYIDEYDPDVVVVLSGVWDLFGWQGLDGEEPLLPGEPGFDDRLLETYEAAVDVLSERGAKIAWLSFPCVKPKAAVGPVDIQHALSDENVRHLNEVVLPRLQERRGGIVYLFALYDLVCPDGVFREKLGAIEDARSDGLHFGKAGARWVARRLEPQLLGLAALRDSEDEPDDP